MALTLVLGVALLVWFAVLSTWPVGPRLATLVVSYAAGGLAAARLFGLELRRIGLYVLAPSVLLEIVAIVLGAGSGTGATWPMVMRDDLPNVAAIIVGTLAGGIAGQRLRAAFSARSAARPDQRSRSS